MIYAGWETGLLGTACHLNRVAISWGHGMLRGGSILPPKSLQPSSLIAHTQLYTFTDNIYTDLSDFSLNVYTVYLTVISISNKHQSNSWYYNQLSFHRYILGKEVTFWVSGILFLRYRLLSYALNYVILSVSVPISMSISSLLLSER